MIASPLFLIKPLPAVQIPAVRGRLQGEMGWRAGLPAGGCCPVDHGGARPRFGSAVVTGAASGIGQALASRLASARARLAPADVQAAMLADVAAELQATAVPTDVGDHELCLLADTGGWEAEFGRDVWQMRLGFTGSQRLTFTRIPQS
jgi:hypothetical protein